MEKYGKILPFLVFPILMSNDDFAMRVSEKIRDNSMLRELRQDVSKMCRQDQFSSFPGMIISRVNSILGSQPVSMNRENMNYLSYIDYCVCEKTDGVRYLLLIWDVGGRQVYGVEQNVLYRSAIRVLFGKRCKACRISSATIKPQCELLESHAARRRALTRNESEVHVCFVPPSPLATFASGYSI